MISATEKILYNRDISLSEQQSWLNAGWESIYDWLDLDDDNKMQQAVSLLKDTIQDNKTVQVILDSDCDGFTSAAIIINYLYDIVPEWAEHHLKFLIHTGKQHGLADLMDEIDCDLLISPDGGTNDLWQQLELAKRGIGCIVLDHHEIEDVDALDGSPAIIINVQNSLYPNKALTGAGVSYKFISAFEDLVVHGNQPTQYMDLCALGNCGDMAAYQEKEIRAIINVGFANIKNPFLYELCQKHKFTLDKRNGINYLSMAFAAVPFLNAICRTGTMAEKEIVFKAMLNRYAFDKVESSKRGEKGKMVYLYQEAVMVAERVKRKQDKLCQESVDILSRKIEEEHLADNAVIVLQCEPDEVEASIAGVVANKIQAKYQHPTLVLRRSWSSEDNQYHFIGSARNYSHCPVENMKTICQSSGAMDFAAGHEGAFGAGIAESNIPDFIDATNKLYDGIDFSPVYWVDFIWTPDNVNGDAILEIAALDIYGQGMPESQVVLKDIPLSESNVSLIGLAKGHPTIKINCNGIELIKFGSSEEEYEQFIQPNQTLTVVATCGKNEWNGKITPQLLIQDYNLEEEWIF